MKNAFEYVKAMAFFVFLGVGGVTLAVVISMPAVWLLHAFVSWLSGGASCPQ